MDKQEIQIGISPYKKEQNILLRLISRCGGLTETNFDELFRYREFKKPSKMYFVPKPEGFILGMGSNGGNLWAEFLDLLQYMMLIGLVGTKRNDTGEIVYFLKTKRLERCI